MDENQSKISRIEVLENENGRLRADVRLLREVLADVRMRLRSGDTEFALMKASCDIAISDDLPYSGGSYDEIVEAIGEAMAERGY